MSAPDSEGQDPLQRLVKQFGTVLDEALISAISFDYDLEAPSQFEAATRVLDGLAQDALAEDATGFNPSGTPGFQEDTKDESTSGTGSRSSTQGSSNHLPTRDSSNGDSHSTDTTFVMPQVTSFNGESEADKRRQLTSMFSDLKPYDIDFALKKAKGDFQTALDDLLNVQFLASSGQRTKGVDGFFKDDDTPGGRGKRKKKKNRRIQDISSDDPVDGASDDGADTPKQQEEVAFLADRIDVPISEVSAVYRREWCSIGATAITFLDQYTDLGIQTQDEDGKRRASELTEKYPGVPAKYMPTIAQVTCSIPEFADDLADLVDKHINNKAPKPKKAFNVSYKLAPITADIEGGSADLPTNIARQPDGKVAAWSHDAVHPETSYSAGDYAEAMSKTARHHQARRSAAESAAAMHRRGASSPLYRQAASYYADRAREQSRYASQATSAAADALVNQQSTSRSVDLHGVYVQDGVRIAKQRVHAWYNGLGYEKARRAREESLTIVTGIGRHSAGGVSQLRQAVAAALLQDGWKVQIETGRFVITGRR